MCDPPAAHSTAFADVSERIHRGTPAATTKEYSACVFNALLVVRRRPSPGGHAGGGGVGSRDWPPYSPMRRTMSTQEACIAAPCLCTELFDALQRCNECCDDHDEVAAGPLHIEHPVCGRVPVG